ncbi:aldose epimerase family protein [Pseudonocardia acaciae]|uniref:aldose epimerase family protein n=1 Tax=Pseudonocardia acaciae TaxID=551276 RepID=UPI0004909A87|nr:aldose epimerase family protein [Pseudonocardia acaciae]
MNLSDAGLDGYPVRLVTLENEHCTAVLTDLGARLLELHVPDRDGVRADVVLGRPDLRATFSDPHYMGSTAGRYAGRIRGATFTLDGRTHHLARNEGANHLHGGARGFDRYAWSTAVHPGEEAVTFSRVSPDGEEGFPGALTAAVTYRLDGPGLVVGMSATTDAATAVRLVHHSYWNLAGHDSGHVLDHVLRLRSGHYVALDDELLPTGEVRAVDATPFDFRDPTPLGRGNARVHNRGAGRVSGDGGGYDHVWVLDGTGMRVVAELSDPASGRRLELATDQPGLCLYAGGYLGGTSAKGGGEYGGFAGVTLETTGFPDDVNIAHFPSPVLRAGETYAHEMRLTFSTT